MKPFLRLIQLPAAAFAAGCEGPAKHSPSGSAAEVCIPAHASGFDYIII